MIDGERFLQFAGRLAAAPNVDELPIKWVDMPLLNPAVPGGATKGGRIMWIAKIYRVVWLGSLSVLLGVSAAFAGFSGDQPVERSLTLPSEGQKLVIEGRSGQVGGGLNIQFGKPGRQSPRFELRASDMVAANHHWRLTSAPDDKLTDACLELKLTAPEEYERQVRRAYFIRPDLHFYLPDDEQYKRALTGWQQLPAASKHTFRLEIARRWGRIELTIDGRFFSSFAERPGLEQLTLKPTDKGQVLATGTEKDSEDLRFLPVDLAVGCHQDDVRIESLSLDPGLQMIVNKPIRVAHPQSHVDVGLARWLRQAKGGNSFYDPYYRRSVWDNLPETIIFSVPKRHYNAAHVLCAVRTDGGRAPSMTLRMARYRQAWDGTGATQADTTVRVDPQQPHGCNSIHEVGNVEVTIRGKKQTLGLYLVEIPLRTGELADVFRMEGTDFNESTDFLYVELTRQLGMRRTVNHSNHEWKPLGPQSGLVVLGLTLEKSPVAVRIDSPETGYVFYKHKSPALQIATSNATDQPVALELSAQVTDYFHGQEEVKLKLSVPPGESKHRFDLDRLELGWYATEITFRDKAGRPLWQQPMSFALLPPDTRKAGDESPYGIWWFKGSHYTQTDPDVALSLIRKLGFRHTTPGFQEKRGQTPEKAREYGVTPSMMRYFRPRKGKDSLEKQTREFVEKWPQVNWGMVFHETRGPDLGIELPPELLGKGKPVLDEESQKRFDELSQQAIEYVQTVKGIKPGMKILLGNGGTPANVHWLRSKFPRSHWNAIGMEMAVQKMVPEGQPNGWNLQSLWIAKRMRKIYGYDDLPITSCYEFDYRATAPGALSLERQAAWYARDVLHCVAYRMPHINVALLGDCNSAYYTSRWGSTGVCGRAPLNMPKPSFVVLATLTRVLDRAEYQRWLDTGSTGAYCLEFKRPDGGYAYAMWTVVGRREMHLEAPFPSVTVVDSMGRQRVVATDAPVVIDDTPLYLLTESPLSTVQAGKPEHVAPTLSDSVVVDPVNDAQRWRVVAEGDEAFEKWCAYSPTEQAKVDLQARDNGGLKVTLHSQPDVPDIVGRYVMLEPAGGPIPIPGKPDTIGIWVHGNSNWGRVFFELTDAKGRRWSSNGYGEAPNSWDLSDWQGDTCISFDGWRLITLRLPDHYAGSGHYGPNFYQWRCHDDNNKENQIAYPIKFSRLYLILREKLVYLTDMVPAKSMSIGLKDLTVDTSPKH